MFKFLNSIIFGKPKEEIKEINKDMKVRISHKDEKPSVEFCKTGILVENEKYNKILHSGSETIKGRASTFYTEEEIKKMIKEVEIEESRFIHDMNH